MSDKKMTEKQEMIKRVIDILVQTSGYVTWDTAQLLAYTVGFGGRELDAVQGVYQAEAVDNYGLSIDEGLAVRAMAALIVNEMGDFWLGDGDEPAGDAVLSAPEALTDEDATAPGFTRLVISALTRRMSRAGNATWQAEFAGEGLLYVREQDMRLFRDAGWGRLLDGMAIDERVSVVDMSVDAVRNGKFWDIVAVSIFRGHEVPAEDATVRAGHELRAIKRAHESLTNAGRDLICFDVETTGLDRGAEIVQIAVVNGAGEVLFESLVKPQHSIPADASAIHGITDASVVNAPRFPEVHKQIVKLMKNKTWAGYNVGFDVARLTENIALHEREPIPCAGVIDVMDYAAEYIGDWSRYHGNYRSQKLDRACARFGIVIEGAHDAAADAVATVKLLRAMAEEYGEVPVSDDDVVGVTTHDDIPF